MKPFRPALIALVLMLAACTSLPGRDSDVEAVLTASGIDAQLGWLSQPLQGGKMKGPLSLVPDDWITAINATVAEQLKPADIRLGLRAALQRELTGRELADVQRFYESATGQAVVAVESGRLQAGINADTTEAATLEALATATGLGKAVARLAETGLGDAFDIALKTNCFGQGETRFASLLGGVIKKAQLNALRTVVNEQVRLRYAALGADDQARYLSFAQSRPGQKFFRVRGEVLGAAAERAGSALGAQLTPRFNEFCKPAP